MRLLNTLKNVINRLKLKISLKSGNMQHIIKAGVFTSTKTISKYWGLEFRFQNTSEFRKFVLIHDPWSNSWTWKSEMEYQNKSTVCKTWVVRNFFLIAREAISEYYSFYKNSILITCK